MPKYTEKKIAEPNSGRAERICLKCSKMFKSAGPGNRICSTCTTLNKKITTVTSIKD